MKIGGVMTEGHRHKKSNVESGKTGAGSRRVEAEYVEGIKGEGKGEKSLEIDGQENAIGELGNEKKKRDYG